MTADGRNRCVAALAATLAWHTPGLAQVGVVDTVRTVAGAQYDAGGLHRFFFGSDYRTLWRTPIRVPVLDLHTVGGGLTPTTAGGGFQTKSLRFRDANGLLYGFRSVDKDPAVLPPGLAGTFVEDLVQDQTSSAHPAGAGIVPPLLAAAGILHTEPRLVVLPDDPLLGEFRERFAGTLGYFELRAVVAPGAQRFAGAIEILDSDDLYPMLRASPTNRVGARRFLAARLIDLLIGDWDRHRGQWSWARCTEGPIVRWVPIPEDRDQAFVRFDGLFLGVARHAAAPQLVNFGEDYPNMVGLTWNGRESDRWFLVSLERAVWDSVAGAVAGRLTDSVLDAAVAGMPPAYRTLDGDRMRRALRSRRDRLRDAAAAFYRVVMRQADVHGTDAAEDVTIERLPGGEISLRVTARPAGSEPYFDRVFSPGETREMRLYLYGGDDRVVVRGDGPDRITVRVVGGGSDVVVDSSRAGGVRLYATGADRTAGPTAVHVDRRPYVPPPTTAENALPPRDWGHRWQTLLWAGFGPDIGAFVGGGAFLRTWGFRKIPFGSHLRWRAGAATAARTFRAEFAGTFYRTNSRTHVDLFARASGIDVLRFNGLGNDVALTEPDEFYRVNQQHYTVQPSVTFALGTAGTLTVGPIASFSRTASQAGRIIESTQPYGAGDFGAVGGEASVRFDSRDAGLAATRGAFVELAGAVYPELWDVSATFGEVRGVGSTYLTVGGTAPAATLALRAGGKKVWGTFPFQAAAFIGDEGTVRLARQNRYGGDAAVWANAELRIALARSRLFLPGRVGIFGLADAGRVFLEGESSDAWHTAFGGGIWLSFLQPSNTLSIAVARGDDERTAVYARAGFAY